MQIGKLNRQVTIQTLTETPNGAGGFVQSWDDTGVCMAAATPVGGTEGLVTGRLAQSQGWRIVIRHRPLTAAAQRLVLDGKVLNIVSVEDPDGRRQVLVVMAEYLAVPA